jgi:hypothetical protein
MSKAKFFGRPTLGGWLSMLNGLLVVVIVAGLRFAPRVLDDQELYFILPLVALTAPLSGGIWWPRIGGGPTNLEVIVDCVLIGLNSLLWGYGVAAIISRASAGFRRLRFRHSSETIASADT